MAKRIGILVLGDERWAGGLYYPINIIKALRLLPEKDQPEIFALYGNDTALEALKKLQDKKITLIRYNQTPAISLFHKVFRKIFKRDLITSQLAKKHKLDTIYPYNFSSSVSGKVRTIAWFPDFQHKYLPQFFTADEIKKRDHYLATFDRYVHEIVFSSDTALHHFKLFYPDSTARTHVFKFASAPASNLTSWEDVQKKYRIEGDFFLVANQFWPHKNHLLVIEALKELQAKNFTLVFTGKQDEPYFSEVKNLCGKYKITNQVRFAGFIPREDQLALMKYSLAVIQPSQFEGWSTVIEDARTLNKLVLASRIDIHVEQLGEQGKYFGVDNAGELASQMKELLETGNVVQVNYTAYEQRALTSAKVLLEIF